MPANRQSARKTAKELVDFHLSLIEG